MEAKDFAREIAVNGWQAEIARALWDSLREAAFVRDFRPKPDDRLSDVFAMGPEEVRDDLVDPLLTELGLTLEGIDFTDFDFASIATPKDVAVFLVRVAGLQREGRGRCIFVEVAAT